MNYSLQEDFQQLVTYMCNRSGLNSTAVENAVGNIMTEENYNKFCNKLLENMSESDINQVNDFLKSDVYHRYLEASSKSTALVGEMIKDYFNLLLSQTAGTA